jgi:hypothetical protein
MDTTLADIVELCRERGWTGVGPDHDLLKWLRRNLRDVRERESYDDMQRRLKALRAAAKETAGVFGPR